MVTFTVDQLRHERSRVGGDGHHRDRRPRDRRCTAALPSGLTATHDGSAVTVSMSTTELVSVHSTATCS